MTCDSLIVQPTSQAERMRSFGQRKMGAFTILNIETSQVSEEGAALKCSTLAVQTLSNESQRSHSAPILRAEGEASVEAVTLLGEENESEEEGAFEPSTVGAPHVHRHSPYPHAVIQARRESSRVPETQLNSFD